MKDLKAPFKGTPKGVMVSAISGMFILTIISTTASAGSRHKLTLDALNANINWCYEATLNTEEIKNAQGDLSKYTKPCDKILRNKLKPRNVESNALFNRGVIKFYGKQYSSAEEDLKQALALTPDLHQAHIALGEIAIKQQNFAQALNHYQSAVNGDSDNKALSNKRDWVLTQLPASYRDAPGLDPAEKQAMAN